MRPPRSRKGVISVYGGLFLRMFKGLLRAFAVVRGFGLWIVLNLGCSGFWSSRAYAEFGLFRSGFGASGFGLSGLSCFGGYEVLSRMKGFVEVM